MLKIIAAIFVLQAGFSAERAFADEMPVKLVTGKPIAPDVASYPRIAAAPNVAADKINAALARDERTILSAREDCKKSDGQKQSSAFDYSVTINVAMHGPGFVSYVKDVHYNCPGAAHPDHYRLALVFSIETGKMVDWYKLLPATLLDPAADSLPGKITSTALGELYRANISNGDLDKTPDCKEAIDTFETFQFYPNPETDGVVLLPDTSYVTDICAWDITVPADRLRKLGANTQLLDAIQTAHDRGWYDKAKPN